MNMTGGLVPLEVGANATVCGGVTQQVDNLHYNNSAPTASSCNTWQFFYSMGAFCGVHLGYISILWLLVCVIFLRVRHAVCAAVE